ncbi:hypothetical protein, partial [Arthrobacter sp. H14]|uniref:hypothetical protein n=1 Tax=Arthrobacter sp. H14 TaxID=1312959 RepID=UPI001C1E1D01
MTPRDADHNWRRGVMRCCPDAIAERNTDGDGLWVELLRITTADGTTKYSTSPRPNVMRRRGRTMRWRVSKKGGRRPVTSSDPVAEAIAAAAAGA